MFRIGQIATSLWLVVMVVLGPSTMVPSRHCPDCRRECPMMNARRVGCHERLNGAKCHLRSGPILAAASCGHHGNLTVPSSPWLAVIALRTGVTTVHDVGTLTQRPSDFESVAFTEPLTDPPRATPPLLNA